MILKDQITTIFVQIDDFCKEFDLQIKNLKLNPNHAVEIF